MRYDNLAFLLHRASQLLRQRFSELLEPHGVTVSQFALLQQLHESQSTTATPAQLAERMGADRPTVSGLIRRMEGKGWIHTAPHPEDRRSVTVSLTKAGASLHEFVYPLSLLPIEEGTAELEKKEEELLKQSLHKIIHRLEGDRNHNE